MVYNGKPKNFRKHLLITAQSFGFGPASKALAIAKAIKKISPHTQLSFAAEKLAFQFIKTNSNNFTELIEIKKVRDYLPLIKTKKYSQLISVMEPASVVFAHYTNLPVITIDSLFWFWNWPKKVMEKPEKLIKEFSTLEKKSIIYAYFKFLQKRGPHQLQLISHLFSDYVFIQNLNIKKLCVSRLNLLKNYKLVGPIIWTGDNKIYTYKKEYFIINLCGQISPLVNEDQASSYANFIVELVKSFSDVLPKGITPIIVGNAEIMDYIKKTFNITAIFVSRDRMDKLLSRAICMASPPSLTSILEANSMKVPVIILPEQHDGHWANFERLRQNIDTESFSKYVFPGVLLAKYFHELRGLKEEKIDLLYKTINDLLKEPKSNLLKDLSQQYINIIQDINEPKGRKKITQNQAALLTKLLNTQENGAKQIARFLLNKKSNQDVNVVSAI